MKGRTFAVIVVTILMFSLLFIPTHAPPVEEKVTESVKDSFNFQSRSTIEIKNVNDRPVTVDVFERNVDETKNNPSTGEGILIWECIKYKMTHPEDDVSIYMATFHYSIVASVCLDPDSSEYGQMCSLSDEDYNDDGYCRISYLMVLAAKMGINTTTVGQINAANYICDDKGTWKSDIDFEQYFLSHLNDECIPEYAGENKKVSDYMTFKKAKWVSYGDKSATDMMHLKICAVSNYIDTDGNVGGPGLYLASTNLDAIHYGGCNVNNGVQTGVIISNHQELFDVTANYFRKMVKYCEVDDIYEFRNLINRMNCEQVDLLKDGKTIDKNEQIVYLGSDKDKIFELYFTPTGGNSLSWETDYDPCCRYITEMSKNACNGHVVFAWCNPNFDYFQKSNTMMNSLINTFHDNPNYENRLFLNLGGADVSSFNNLTVGGDIGFIKTSAPTGHHNKDMQLSYIDDEERQYISLLMTANFHAGGNTYQVNTILVIKETNEIGHQFFDTFGKYTTYGCIGKEKA